jgi:hypothetical protein
VDLKDKKAVEREYLPQIEEFLRKVIGADRVHAFDYTVRWVCEDCMFLLVDWCSFDK